MKIPKGRRRIYKHHLAMPVHLDWAKTAKLTPELRRVCELVFPDYAWSYVPSEGRVYLNGGMSDPIAIYYVNTTQLLRWWEP